MSRCFDFLGGNIGGVQLFRNDSNGSPVGRERHQEVLQNRSLLPRIHPPAIFLLRRMAESGRDFDKSVRRRRRRLRGQLDDRPKLTGLSRNPNIHNNKKIARFTDLVFDRRRNASRPSGAGARPVLGRGVPARAALHAGGRAVPRTAPAAVDRQHCRQRHGGRHSAAFLCDR